VRTTVIQTVRNHLICGSTDIFYYVKIVPLLKRNERTAAALVAHLRHEAEELRKEKKRNTISGIHKYVRILLRE